MRLLKSHPIVNLFLNTGFWYKMLSTVMTLIIYFVLTLAVTVLIKAIFNQDTLHCAEQASDAYAAAKNSKGKLVIDLLSDSSQTIPEHIASGTSSMIVDQQQEVAVNTANNPTRATVARAMGKAVEYTVNNFQFSVLQDLGIPAGTIAAVAWENTPGNVYAKSFAAGLRAGTVTVGLAGGHFIKRWLNRPNPEANTTQHSDSTSSTNSNANSINPDYSIHSSLEEEDSISSCPVSIYEYLLGWMKHHDSNRLPSNKDGTMFDLSNYNFFFTSFNLIVYLMFTAVLYYIFIGFVQLSLKYYNNIVSRISNFNSVVYTTSTSAMDKILVVTKVMLILVFVFGMACSLVLYIYYHLPIEVAKHLNSTMITKVNKSTDYAIGYSTAGVSFYYSQKFYTFVITIILGFYRTYMLIKPLECAKYTKIVIVFISVNFVAFVTKFITNMVALNSTGLTFVELFNKCNNGIDLVFYSFVTAILSSVIQYFFLLSKEKKSIKICSIY